MDDYTEIALQNIQAANSKLPKKLNGDLYRDKLPTRDEVLEVLRDCYKYVDADHGVCFSPTMAVNELIARGWLRVKS